MVDGSLDWSQGVNSVKVSTVASAASPTGLSRNELAWLVNATTRDGGITQRTGWEPLVGLVNDGSALFQGAHVYEPDSGDPYIIASIGGNILKVTPTANSGVVNLSTLFGLHNPPNEPQAYFCQGENYLVIQAGDNATLPLFWDGTTLRRSKGITNTAVAPGTPGVNEIPAATAMDYYQNRIWYANFRQVNAGDIVGGNSGTVGNHRRDAILNVTENPMVVGGDGFTLPTNSGNIRALKHSANMNSALGQGNLFIFTRKAVYSLVVPLSRKDWIAANNTAAGAGGPQITIVQLTNGSVNDRTVVSQNGDLFYQSLDPAVRSLISGVRNFGAGWANPAISSNEQRILQFNDRSLMHLASGIVFDNRLLQTVLPEQRPQGVICGAIIALDFTPLSTLQNQLPPVWQGHFEGLDFLQLLQMDFNGRERAFAFIVSRIDQSIQLWELSNAQRFEGGTEGDRRITWQCEFPAFTWNKEFDLKKVVSAELWLDKVYGEVELTLEYRGDSDPCWHPWHVWKVCTARNSCENVQNPVCYPIDQYRESFKATMTLPVPPSPCVSATGRPANILYQCQPRLTIKGWARVRGLLLHAEQVERKLYAGMVC